MATSPALLSRQYARPSPPLPRQLLAPSPVVVASPAARLRVRRGPSPAQAKFGKFDAADAPTEAEPAAPATSEVDGAAEQAVLEDDRSGTLPTQAALLWIVARLTDRVRCSSLSLWFQLPAVGFGGRDMAVREGQRRFRQLRRHARNCTFPIGHVYTDLTVWFNLNLL